MSTVLPRRGTILGVALLAVSAALPLWLSSPYALSVMVLTGMFLVFALSYDLSVGHVGTVHLAPAAFFGLGAYVTALVGVPAGLPFWANMVLSAAAMAVAAVIVGVPSFRLSNVTFAIGTLAFATVAQQVVNSAVDITRGPLCVQGIPRPALGSLEVTTPAGYYYLLLPFVVGAVVVYRMMTAGRLGRTFAAVHQDEVLAAAAGIRPLQYKMLAFVVGAAMAGALGSFQAHYLSVICPTELATDYTITLLIIVFVGGAGSLPGLVVGSVVFTVLPELMRGLGAIDVTPAHQLILFGLILLVVITRWPDGLQQLWARRRPPIPEDQALPDGPVLPDGTPTADPAAVDPPAAEAHR